MAQQTINILIAYWVITTIIGVYWMIKNPTFFEDKRYFSLAEVIAYLLPSMLLAWFLVPFTILTSIKFKR